MGDLRPENPQDGDNRRPGGQDRSAEPGRLADEKVSWVDLLDIGGTQRVLLVTPGSPRVESDLRARTRQVDVIGPDTVPAGRHYDLICVDGVHLSRRQRRRLVALLTDDGRWAQVSDNVLSPLRGMDRVRGRSGGGDVHASLTSLRWRLRRDTGLAARQVFVLLRSSRRPVTAFDILSRTGMAHTLAAGLTHIDGARGVLMRIARRLPPRAAAPLAPGWLVVAATPAHRLDPHRVVGKVANNDSDTVKILRGDPPTEIEKRFIDYRPTAEATALRELAERGFELSPRLLESGEGTLRCSWLRGDTLEVSQLDEDALVVWTGRAASVLKELRRTTRDPDGSVLVHGDFWLGNMIVEDERISGVIDWTFCRRGSAGVDRDFLVSSLAYRSRTRPDLPMRLARVVDERLA